MDKVSESHCVHMFTQVHVDNLGFYSPCCHFRSKLRVELDDLTHVTDCSPSEYLNSMEMVEFRKRVNAGEQIPECSHCFDLEEKGSASMRTQDNQIFRSRMNQAGTLPEGKQLLSLDFRAGNLCNFGCVTCSPFASSKLDSLWKQHGAENFAREGTTMGQYNLRVNVVDWYKNPELFDVITSECENIQQLTLVGGEPLASPENLRLLKSLKHRGKDLRLEVSSNGSLISPEIIEILENFQTYFKFSMDGIDDVCEYIRYPADFQVLENNVEMLLDSEIKTGIIVTISVLNLMNLKEQYLWARDKAEKKQNHLIFYMANFVHMPEHLSVAHLPDQLKQKAKMQVEWIQNDLKFNPSNFISTYGSESSLLLFLKNSSEAPEKIRNGWKYIEYYDKVRGTDWKNIAGYLEEVINP